MDEITKEKFTELTDAAVEAKRRTYVIIEDADGNYRGTTTKFGKVVFVRAGDPATVLTMLITHP